MSTKDSKTSQAGTPDVLRDLIDDGMLHLQEGERLWKIHIFHSAAGRGTHLEHRIYTKLKADGHLALVTFAVHTPVVGRSARSGVARVADLTPGALDHLIDAIRQETRVGSDEYVEVDVSHLATLPDQLAHLRQLLGDA